MNVFIMAAVLETVKVRIIANTVMKRIVCGVIVHTSAGRKWKIKKYEQINRKR